MDGSPVINKNFQAKRTQVNENSRVSEIIRNSKKWNLNMIKNILQAQIIKKYQKYINDKTFCKFITFENFQLN